MSPRQIGGGFWVQSFSAIIESTYVADPSQDRGMRVNISESVWARGWRDTKAAVGTIYFWGVELIGGGLIGIQWGALWGLWFVLAVALVVLIVAIGAASLWQRNEARRELAALWRWSGIRRSGSTRCQPIRFGRAILGRSSSLPR